MASTERKNGYEIGSLRREGSGEGEKILLRKEKLEHQKSPTSRRGAAKGEEGEIPSLG